MLGAQAVDVLQADVTRCLGITGFLHAAALRDAFACRSRRTARRRCTCTLRALPAALVHLE